LRRILLIFKNDLRRRLKSPLSVIILMVIPIFMTGIMGLVFAPSSNNQMARIQVLVTDNDGEIVSRFLKATFESPQMRGMFEISYVDEKVGINLMEDGRASALIIIPKGFSHLVLANKKAQLRVIKNPSEQFMPTIVEDFMRTYAVVISGFTQIFGDQLSALNLQTKKTSEGEGIEYLSRLMFSGQIKGFDQVISYINPLMINLKTELKKKVKKTTSFNLFTYILPAISVMFLLFIIEIFLREILSEREDGKLQRIMFSPIRVRELILGRIISGWLMGIMVYGLIIIVGILLFKIQWGNYGLIFIMVAITCFWIASFFALLNSFFKNKNQAGSFSAPIVMVFSAFGGSMVPINQLPDVFNLVSNLTINHWFAKGITLIIEGSFPLLPIVVILISGLILFTFAVKSLKKRILV